MIIIDNVAQGSEEWFGLKLGKPSSSNFSKILTAKGRDSATAERYMFDLAMERVTGKKKDGFKSAAMENGNEMEPESRRFYEFKHNCDVDQVAVVFKNDKKLFLCSPDGLIRNKKAGLELKNVEDFTQWGYIQNPDSLVAKYHRQLQGSLFITGYDYWDIMSYNPNLDPVEVRVYPNLDFHDILQVKLERFCAELDELTARIKALSEY